MSAIQQKKLKIEKQLLLLEQEFLKEEQQNDSI